MAQIIITSIGTNKLGVIKVVRQYTGTSLSEAKQFVEAVSASTPAKITFIPQDKVASVLADLSAVGANAQEETGNTTRNSSNELRYNTASAVSVSSSTVNQSTSPLAPARYQAKPTTAVRRLDGSLKGYLHELSTLEVQSYTQSRLISNLKAKINRLGRYRNLHEPEKPSLSLYQLSSNNNGLCILCWSLSLTLALMFAIGLLTGLNELRNWSLLGIVILVPLMFVPDIIDYRSDILYYREKMEKYNKEKVNDSERVKHELLVKTEIELQLKSVQAEYEKTKRALASVYALGIIHNDYRNLVAVCSFYDYFDKGICTCLGGASGAYKFYEEGLRFQRIETRLDVIISKLDEIIANQQQLASLIQEGNASLRRIEQKNNYIAENMNAIQENTALTEYNTRCAAQSASVIESLAIYRTLRYS